MNTVGSLVTGYYELLKNISGFEAFKITVPIPEPDKYLLIYPESGGDDNNKSKKVENVVIRVDIVAKYNNDIDQTAVEDADNSVRDLVAGVTGNSLDISGLQVMNVKREDYTYLIENDGTNYYYRKVTRYTNRVIQV